MDMIHKYAFKQNTHIHKVKMNPLKNKILDFKIYKTHSSLENSSRNKKYQKQPNWGMGELKDKAKNIN